MRLELRLLLGRKTKLPDCPQGAYGQGLRIFVAGQLQGNEGFVVRPARLELAAF